MVSSKCGMLATALLAILNTRIGAVKFHFADLPQSPIKRVQSKYFVEVTDGDKIRLKLVVKWRVSSNLDADGLFVRLVSANQSTNYNVEPNNCIAPHNQYWIQNSKKAHDWICGAHSLQQCDNSSHLEVNDLCEVYKRKNGFRSTSLDQTNVTFEVTFRTESILEVAAYRNRVVNNITTYQLRPEFDCIGLVMNQSFSYENSAKLCHKNKIDERLPQNLQYWAMDYLYDKRQITGLYTWYSPLVSNGLVGFQIVSFYWIPVDFSYVEREIGNRDLCFDFDDTFCLHLVTPHLIVDQGSLSIANETVYLQVALKDWDMRPHLVFATIKSDYADYECLDYELSFTLTDIHCERDFLYCVDGAACLPFERNDNDNSKGHCECPEGYRGNGVNASEVGEIDFGEYGCSPVDSCVIEPKICHDAAICKSSDSGPICKCPSLLSGDGFRNGTGCAHVILPAVLSSVAVLVLLAAFAVGWRVYKHRQLHRWPMHDRVTDTIVVLSLPPVQGDSESMFGKKWELCRDVVAIGEQLGHGNQGVVYRGELRCSEESWKIAVKMLNASHQQNEDVRNFLTEISFMINIGRHKNIVEVLGCCTTTRPVLLVTEYMEHGDLRQFLVSAREEMNFPLRKVHEEIMCGMALDVARGLNYLSSIKIIHGDIAARNILVGDEFVCKISDFGLANDVYRYGLMKARRERCIPFRWVSPERLMDGRVPITTQSDVWSFGNLLYEIVTLGGEPYPDVAFDNMLAFLKAGHRMPKPATCSNHLYTIMSKCWRLKPYLRPRAPELVKMLDGRTPAAFYSNNSAYVNI